MRRSLSARAQAAISATVCVLCAGCISPARTIADPPPGEWTRRLGDPRHAPYVAERVPDSVQVEWDEAIGRGLPVAAIVHDPLIIAVVSGGGIIAASAVNGNRFWGRRFDGSIAGQALRSGDRIYFATQHRNGAVYALDLRRGRRVWTRRLDGRAATEPGFAEQRLYVSTDAGHVLALDAGDGSVLWRIRLSAPAAQPPVVIGDELLVAIRDTIMRLDRNSGAVRARHAVAGTPSAPLAVAGDTLVIAMHPDLVAAYAGRGERELWRQQLGGAVLAAPVIASDAVYALTARAEVFRLQSGFAERIAALDGAATESLTVTADGVLVGLLDGRITFLRRDGTLVWQRQLRGSVRAPAAVSGSSVYVSTLTGRMVKLTSS